MCGPKDYVRMHEHTLSLRAVNNNNNNIHPNMIKGRTLFSRAPQENGALRDQTLISRNPPVLHAFVSREMFSGPSMSMQGIQPSLYNRLPIGRLMQQGPYPISYT